METLALGSWALLLAGCIASASVTTFLSLECSHPQGGMIVASTLRIVVRSEGYADETDKSTHIVIDQRKLSAFLGVGVPCVGCALTASV